jgi:hypothetical protein
LLRLRHRLQGGKLHPHPLRIRLVSFVLCSANYKKWRLWLRSTALTDKTRLLSELGTSDTSIDISIFDTYRIQKKVSKYRTTNFHFRYSDTVSNRGKSIGPKMYRWQRKLLENRVETRTETKMHFSVFVKVTKYLKI